MRAIFFTIFFFIISATLFAQSSIVCSTAEGRLPLSVKIKSKSKNIEWRKWIIDGMIYEQKKLCHTFLHAGVYQIELFETNFDGNTSRLIREIKVLPRNDAKSGIVGANDNQNQQLNTEDYISYKTYDIMFPTAFAPYLEGSNGGEYRQGEGEHTNRIFHPTYADVDEFSMQIFNKHGIQIFETDNIYIGWDGYYANRLCPQDGYIYIASGHYSNGVAFNKTGQFILIHK